MVSMLLPTYELTTVGGGKIGPPTIELGFMLMFVGRFALASIIGLESFLVARFLLCALGFGGGGVGVVIAGDRAITMGDMDLLATLRGGGGVGVILGIFEGGRGKSSGVGGFTIGDIAIGRGGTLPGPELTSSEDSTEL